MDLFPYFFAYSGSFKSQGYSCIRLTSGVRFPFLHDSELQGRAGIRLLFFSFILFPFYRQLLYYLEKEEQLAKGYGCRLWDNKICRNVRLFSLYDIVSSFLGSTK